MAGATDDLATLTSLDEETLLAELKARYDLDRIYTYVGDILVAVNPFCALPLYSKEVQARYRNAPRKEVPPHIYAVADRSYHDMLANRKDQCCVISGESGAGKTESAKYMIKHIIRLCHHGDGGTNLEHKILQVNPLLEAFGNAQTTMNDNSSRFGKYTQLLFGPKGSVLGAQISEYLLEKSRVVSQQDGEQSFHILYYQFCAPKAAEYGLTSPEDFSYVDSLAAVPRAFQAMYGEVMVALNDVGFTDSEQHMIFAILAAILHISQIDFTSTDEHEPASLSKEGDKGITWVCKLLEVEELELRNALTYNMMFTRGKSIQRTYSCAQAYDCRDALSKALYGRLFGWIVSKINELLAPSQAGEQALQIGILDIFGFENFVVNGFEQICINLANEQLQHFFNQHIFENELQEYTRQGIDGAKINYVDNKPLLDLFLKKPFCILSLLDEQCHFPAATDESFVHKAVDQFGKHASFVPTTGPRCVFTINHYAGSVEYTGYEFLEKNRDSLAPDVVNLLQHSGLPLVTNMFLAEVTKTGNLKPQKMPTQTQAKRHRKQRTALPAATQNKTNKRALSVSAQFRNSLQLLVSKMSACAPHFVRCIKPNTSKASHSFLDDFVMKQLNYTGMLETTRIRREGYSVRPSFDEFMEKFKVLAYAPDKRIEASANTCERVLGAVGIDGYLMGRTKVFLKYFHWERLEFLLHERMKRVVTLQKVMRGFLARLEFQTLLATSRKQAEETSKLLLMFETSSQSMADRLAGLNAQDANRTAREAARQKAEAEQRAAAEAERAQREASMAAEDRARMEAERAQALALAKQREAEGKERARQEKLRLEAEQSARLAAQSRAAAAAAKELEQKRQMLAQHPSVKWFQGAELSRGAGMDAKGKLQKWFHGLIPRREAERRLTAQPIGGYLLRVSESRFGYSLSVRVSNRCKHFMIEQNAKGHYSISGNPFCAQNLNQLIEFFKHETITAQGEILTVSCPVPEEGTTTLQAMFPTVAQ